MPYHVPPLLVMVPVLALIVWRRVNRSFGRQPIRRRRMIARIALFAVIGGMLAMSGLHRPALAEGLFGGVLIGGAIGFAGLRLTRFEVDPVKGDCYVPNPWIGALLTVLLLGRLAWRLVVLWPQLQPGPASVSATGAPVQPVVHVSSPLTMLVIGLVIGYYIVYFTGLLIHHRRFQQRRSGNIEA